ncbi:hypothetical protein D9758_003256 [Tetrapyrgos nigripes]|uniref:FAR-17a/AIG1-like protein n=1 Tax=Tetrapyrgos nigripes TaxID=182062 RepID=A0A8H5LQH7_9AGAR|nr:hypothetical protein D9758_003256 [Tetrapyrgos nigripes]
MSDIISQVEVVIASIYWPLLLIAAQLLLQPDDTVPTSSTESPKFARIPLSMDLSLHAVPALFLLTDFMFIEKKYSHNQVTYGAPLVATTFTIWYAWWVERCASFNNGTFPYPFLTNSPFEGRVAIYIGAGSLAFVSFYFMNRLHK